MNEIRLIDANALKKEIQHLGNANPSYWNKCDVVYRQEVLDEIDSAETVITDSLYEAYCKMTDEEFEHTENFTVKTPKGKTVKFIKERPQGEWILKPEMAYQYCCSICNKPKPNMNDYYRKQIKYCAFCGAKMKGGAEK